MSKSKKLGPANDEIPECELVLAMALQNAQARDYKSCVGVYYDAGGNYDGPAPGTTACCFRGALLLEPDSRAFDDRCYYLANGNNAKDGTVPPPHLTDEDLEDWYTGAAFETALRDG